MKRWKTHSISGNSFFIFQRLYTRLNEIFDMLSMLSSVIFSLDPDDQRFEHLITTQAGKGTM